MKFSSNHLTIIFLSISLSFATAITANKFLITSLTCFKQPFALTSNFKLSRSAWQFTLFDSAVWSEHINVVHTFKRVFEGTRMWENISVWRQLQPLCFDDFSYETGVFATYFSAVNTCEKHVVTWFYVFRTILRLRVMKIRDNQSKFSSIY